MYYERLYVSVHDYMVFPDFFFPLPSEMNLSERRERDLGSDFNMGHTDVTYAMLNRWDLSVAQYREKKNGVLFMRIERDGKFFLASNFAQLPIPDDFPVYQAEFTGDAFWIIAPYDVPSFEFEGVSFRSHRWGPLKKADYKEGAMILYEGIEYRIKRIPTVTIDVTDLPCLENGVWDVAWSGSEFVPVLPRHGKLFTSHNRAVSLLRSYAFLELLDDTPVKSVTVGGPFYTVNRTNDVVLEGGNSGGADPWHRKLQVFDDMYNYTVDSDIVISSVPLKKRTNVVVGAKLALFSGSKLFVFKDEEKSYDFIGGKSEPCESSLDTLNREIEEECPGLMVAPKRLCVSIETVGDTQYQSVIYLSPYVQDFASIVPYTEALVCVPWLSRLLKAIEAELSSFVSYTQLYAARKIRSPSITFYPTEGTVAKQKTIVSEFSYNAVEGGVDISYNCGVFKLRIINFETLFPEMIDMGFPTRVFSTVAGMIGSHEIYQTYVTWKSKSRESPGFKRDVHQLHDNLNRKELQRVSTLRESTYISRSNSSSRSASPRVRKKGTDWRRGTKKSEE